jgi:putative acetyltransferase
MEVRSELPGDEAAIAAVIVEAFASAEHSDGTEAQIVEKLKAAGALTVSLVALTDGQIVGHVAISPVTIDGLDCGWFGLGPVAVLPRHQKSRIGSALIQRALGRLRELGAAGCVLVGEPSYYSRFGFAVDKRLVYPGVPPEYFQAIAFTGSVRAGTVAYHPAFG